MHEPDHDHEDIDQRLADLQAKTSDFVDRCWFRSASRVAGETRRLAKSEGRLIHYLHALFIVTNEADNLLDPESKRDAAIELISLLESEDRARSIQPDLPEAQYAHAVSWYSACAYDNLAKATAQLGGYNSEGVHQCIAEGIDVCRRTGKLQCVTCFREYATDVYCAADDLDMAMHFARGGAANNDPGPHDRRWVGAKDLARLHLLRGDLAAAAEAAERAKDVAKTFHTPRISLLKAWLQLREVYHLLGEPERAERSVAEMLQGTPFADVQALCDLPAGENPLHEVSRDQVEAVVRCCAGDYPGAIALLSKWDRVLAERGCQNDWFEHRLRLLAAQRLAGGERELKLLGGQLEAKARAARDWLTLRCLERILDPAEPPAPLPTTAALQAGPFAPQGSPQRRPTADTAAAVAEPKAAASNGESPPRAVSAPAPPPQAVQAFWGRLAEAHADERRGDTDDADAARRAILADLLAIDPASALSVDDACWHLHLLQQLAEFGSNGTQAWQWAEKVAAPHRRDATAVSLLATVGAALRHGPAPELADVLSDERLEAMFRESLDLDATRPRNFRRAGDYFLFLENLGEAERCYARGFRLDRTDDLLAGALAQVYRRTDRDRDALAVLDMCLRQGCEASDIPWQAALLAFRLKQYDATLAYLEHYERASPGEPWVNYYRAAALLELERPAAALDAAEEESRRNADCPFHWRTHRAAALGALGQVERFREALADVLAMRLADVGYLTPFALASLVRRLWLSSAYLPSGDSLREQLEARMLAASLAPDELFHAARQNADSSDDVHFYRCTLRQPLDGRWNDWPGRLAGESDWQACLATWGVLAGSPDEAAQYALSWQAKVFPLPAEVGDVESDDDTYTDRPGVVWQGYREEADAGE